MPKEAELIFAHFTCPSVTYREQREWPKRESPLRDGKKSVPLHSQADNIRASPTRPAPHESPQGLIAARVVGCSGAM